MLERQLRGLPFVLISHQGLFRWAFLAIYGYAVLNNRRFLATIDEDFWNPQNLAVNGKLRILDYQSVINLIALFRNMWVRGLLLLNWTLKVC